MNSGSGGQVSIVDDDDIKFRKTQQLQQLVHFRFALVRISLV